MSQLLACLAAPVSTSRNPVNSGSSRGSGLRSLIVSSASCFEKALLGGSDRDAAVLVSRHCDVVGRELFWRNDVGNNRRRRRRGRARIDYLEHLLRNHKTIYFWKTFRLNEIPEEARRISEHLPLRGFV
jgi:hypothetical protein